MNKISALLLAFLLVISCKSPKSNLENTAYPKKFTIAFGSCNKLALKNNLWDDVLKAQPDLWIWGGDIVYADTKDVLKIRAKYDSLNGLKRYIKLKKKVPVIGTWDDHDYGLNDGGKEFSIKKQSQAAFLDFMGISVDDPRRNREGVYAAHDYNIGQSRVKVLVLDTRYFRSAIIPDEGSEKRYKPNAYDEGTILGEAQWGWLKDELNDSGAEYNIIVSSIQFLSAKHGFETWGNFPHEVDKLKDLIVSSNAKGVILLSGDRHISEISMTSITGLSYPLIDFTSSGLTHAYSDFSGETNPYRVGKVVTTESFGLISIDLNSGTVLFQMIGDGGEILGGLYQKY